MNFKPNHVAAVEVEKFEQELLARFPGFRNLPPESAWTDHVPARRRSKELKSVGDDFQAKRRATWERQFPELYREPWDWRKADPRVSEEEFRKIENWKLSPKGLYVFGPTGIGKSRAVFQRMDALVQQRIHVVAISGMQFAQQALEASKGDRSMREWLEEMSNPTILFIDDPSHRWTPTTEKGMLGVLEERSRWKRPTVFTSNFDGVDIEAMGERPGH
jgi:hypothetical protein